jgi:hypothetical protein
MFPRLSEATADSSDCPDPGWPSHCAGKMHDTSIDADQQIDRIEHRHRTIEIVDRDPCDAIVPYPHVGHAMRGASKGCFP